ncbi:MAG: hypothetical protein ACI4JD_03800 [Ruminococcus sp.]
MKKILNRVVAAAMAVPMVFTQGAMMNVNAADTGAKALTLNSFTAIPADQTVSTWNTKMLAVVASMEGTEKTIAKADFLEMIPEVNIYATLLKEIMTEAPDPVLTVKNNTVTVKGTANLTSYAESEVYPKVRKALEDAGCPFDVTLDTFNKTVEYAVTVDFNTLADSTTVKLADVTLTCDGTDITTGTVSYFKGLTDELVASVKTQINDQYQAQIDNLPAGYEEFEANADQFEADLTDAKDLDVIKKLEKVADYLSKVNTFERSGSYATADEALAAVAKFINNREGFYNFPASVDEAVSRHGNGFNKAVEILNGISSTNGYKLNVTVDDVAALAKEGSDFEVAISGGVYDVTFNIPDEEAAEVEAYVNANAEDGMVYDYSYKVVEVKGVPATGTASLDITREIVLKKADDTTTTTTTTTTSDTTTTTTTTTTTDTNTSDTTTTTTTSDTTSDTTTTTTTTSDTTSDTTTTTTTTDSIPAEFVLESVEVVAGKGYYFSHDENAFDLASLVSELTLVGTLDGEAYTVAVSAGSIANYLTPEFATPADYFNAVEGTAYVANTLGLKFTPSATMNVAENADLTVTDLPMVYIGVKGDANLDGEVKIADAQLVLTYYANAAVNNSPSINDDADLAVLAYFLADVDTESKAGADTEDAKLTIADAKAILTYYAMNSVMLNPVWDEIIGK